MSLLVALGVVALLGLSACTAGTPDAVTTTITSSAPADSTSSSSPASPGPSADPSTATSQGPAPARVTTDLGSGTGLNPTTPVTVTVSGGTLTSVTLTNPKEPALLVTGTLSADKRSWTSTEVLGYGKSYLLTVTAANAQGTPATTKTPFTTLKPASMTLPYFQTVGGYPLHQGATFGVGLVAVVHFTKPVTNRAAVEKALHVTTDPHVTGSWYWGDDQDVYFRPEQFWAAGTTVTIDADIYGVQVSPGVYGESDESTHFTIGRVQITHAYDSAPNGIDTVVVTNGSGTVLRTMNTSMGQQKSETLKNGRVINFYTLNGTYTVLDHKNPQLMSSASYGLPADAPGGYAPEEIPWSTRISTGGIFLHELNATIYDQNHGIDASNGCLNLDTADAKWFYQHSIVGDPVIVQGAAGAPDITFVEGGEWSVPWSTWLAGSALH